MWKADSLEDPNARKDWRGRRRRGWQRTRWLDGINAAPTQWTWVWANSRWRTRMPGVLQSMVSQRVGTIKWLDNNNNKSYIYTSFYFGASLVVLVVKNLAANEGDARNSGFIPGSGRSPGEVSGNPLQYSCLENPMDRGAWQSTVHGVTESQTWLKGLSTHAGMNIFLFYM